MLNDKVAYVNIYIPIWLDLLSLDFVSHLNTLLYLHSNMVRFIIYQLSLASHVVNQFTFQYG